MIRIQLKIQLDYEVGQPGADFVFNIHGARTPQQTVSDESLILSQDVAPNIETDAATGNRYMRVHATPGALAVKYAATIDLNHHRQPPETVHEVPIRELPADVVKYLYPSRYCQSDRLGNLVQQIFGGVAPGYARVVAVRDWVRANTVFTANVSNSNTSAIDTLIERVGVCRDFAHLMIALCRALSIPARFATGTDYGADESLGRPDFHAYVEVYLGHRWYIFDPSGAAIPLGLIRLGTGRDAADVAFATIFGAIMAQAPTIDAIAVDAPAEGWLLPAHTDDAISTDAG